MSVLDEMARDWVKRLCVAQADYCNKLDLLTVEYTRMSDADRAAVQTAVGGEGGFVVALAGIPVTVLRQYVGDRPGAKYGIVLRFGSNLPLNAVAQTCGQIEPDVLSDLICLLGLGACAAHEQKAIGPLLRAINFVSGKCALVVGAADRVRQAILEDLHNRMEEAIVNAAKKGQA